MAAIYIVFPSLPHHHHHHHQQQRRRRPFSNEQRKHTQTQKVIMDQ